MMLGVKGTESSLTECSHGGLKHHDCLQAQDARVVCSDSFPVGELIVPQRGPTLVRAVGPSGRMMLAALAGSGPSHSAHTQEEEHITVSMVTTQVLFVQVLSCRSLHSPQTRPILPLHGEEVQLTCTLPSRILCNAVEFIFYLNGDSVMNVTVGSSQPRATLTKFKMDDSHQGSYSCLYRTHSNGKAISSPYSNATKVVLLQPHISLSPPNGGMFWEPHGPEVIRGHSFSIICSIHPQYPGGLFYLDFSGSNRTETTPAVNHSACFHFPVAEYTDQGKYSCSYGVNISTRSFRSANSELAVTIRASMVLIIASGGSGGLALLFLLLLVICLVSRRTRRSSKPSTETDQRECIDNRHNRGEDNEEGEDYVNFENVCYERGLEDYVHFENVCYERGLERGKRENKNEEEKGHSYGKSEDVYDNKEENTHEKMNSEDDEEDYVNVSAQDNAVTQAGASAGYSSRSKM
ncbi:uncharacterized protein [Salvelinus alpinus]|uniref:uncharacterized protein isoform X3 n=1 Tax=Salvelinus alpinus TaxID=8036 RepID=UPI0039FC1C53